MAEEVKKSYLAQVESGDLTVGIEKQEKDVQRHILLLDNIKKDWAVKCREFELLKTSARIIEPKYEYQKLDEYWAIQNDYRELEQQRQKIDFDDRIAQLEKVIKAKQDELARLKGEMK